MKKSINYVDAAQFEALILETPGLEFSPQAGFVKVTKVGLKGFAVYVAKTKKVGRVDLSGFGLDIPGVTALGEYSFGQVTHQLDFTLPEDEILKTFKAVLKHLGTKLTEADARPRKKPAPKASDAKGWSVTSGTTTPAAEPKAKKAKKQKAEPQPEPTEAPVELLAADQA
ncbi:MAG TPA: hypothetical protein VFT74_16135 [Isosphaeraceae bacterium]|nr:hypothetical protein [Isosphaeraceae bacterium]